MDLRRLADTFPDGEFWKKKEGEANKDFWRRVFRFMTQAEAGKFYFPMFPQRKLILQAAELADVRTLPAFWKKFLEYCVQHKLVFCNWPARVTPVPGTASFEPNKTEASICKDYYLSFLNGTNVHPMPRFERWAEGKHMISVIQL